MGEQIIRCPDGTYAVYSEGTLRKDDVPAGEWAVWFMTRQDVIQRFVDRAVEDAKHAAARVLERADSGKVIRPFGMTFEAANARSAANGGPDLTTEEGRMSGEEAHAKPQAPTPAERYAKQAKERLARRIGEDLAEEFTSVATDAMRDPQTVAELMAAAYQRGLEDRG